LSVIDFVYSNLIPLFFSNSIVLYSGFLIEFDTTKIIGIVYLEHKVKLFLTEFSNVFFLILFPSTINKSI